MRGVFLRVSGKDEEGVVRVGSIYDGDVIGGYSIDAKVFVWVIGIDDEGDVGGQRHR